TARASLPGALPGAPQPFPAIAQALAALRQAGQPVPEAVARHLPHVGKALAQGMIAAASPARGENFGALEMLLRPLLEQAGRSDLADALRQELGRLVASHQQADEGEWRLTIIP